jgi:predicted ATP-binding protein involved in virulence
MRIKELKLHNFRGIKDLHLVFNPEHNVVVLVGVNGVGKSSVLDCINLLIYYYCEIYTNENIHGGNYFNYEEFILDSDINIGSDFTINQIKVGFEKSWDVEWKATKQKDNNDGKFGVEIYRESRKSIV